MQICTKQWKVFSAQTACALLLVIRIRRYAKRQFTWFRRDPGTLWIDPTDPNNLDAIV